MLVGNCFVIRMFSTKKDLFLLIFFTSGYYFATLKIIFFVNALQKPLKDCYITNILNKELECLSV